MKTIHLALMIVSFVGVTVIALPSDCGSTIFTLDTDLGAGVRSECYPYEVGVFLPSLKIGEEISSELVVMGAVRFPPLFTHLKGVLRPRFAVHLYLSSILGIEEVDVGVVDEGEIGDMRGYGRYGLRFRQESVSLFVSLAISFRIFDPRILTGK